MTTNHHTPITTGAAANAATFNGPLSQLDSALTNANTNVTNLDTDLTTLEGEVTTIAMNGLMLAWNSATSITLGTGSCYAENGDFINVTSALVKSGLSLSPSTWYHVYVYLSGGSPAAEVVTTAPAAWKGTAYRKTSDTSRRYVGSIKTDGSGNIIKFVHDVFANQMLYMKFQLNASPFRVLSGGTATTAAAVSLTSMVPVTATIPSMRIVSSADQAAYISDDNGVGSTQFTHGTALGNTIQYQNMHLLPMDASQQVWYKFASAPGAGGLSLDVAGYVFNR